MAVLTHPGLGRSRSIAGQAGAFLAFLILQNLLGTVVNLYVTLPSGAASFSWVFGSSPALAAHLILAVLLVGMSIGMLLTARRLPDPRVRRGAWVALVGTILATYGGGSYTFYMQNPALSLLMEVGFLVAAVGAIVVLYCAAQRIGAAVPPHVAPMPTAPL